MSSYLNIPYPVNGTMGRWDAGRFLHLHCLK